MKQTNKKTDPRITYFYDKESGYIKKNNNNNQTRFSHDMTVSK